MQLQLYEYLFSKYQVSFLQQFARTYQVFKYLPVFKKKYFCDLYYINLMQQLHSNPGFLDRIKKHLLPFQFSKIKFSEINKAHLHDLVRMRKQNNQRSENENLNCRLSYLLKILSKLLNVYGQMRNKIRPVERQFSDINHYTTNSYETLIQQLSNTKCIGQSEFLIENIPISSPQMLSDCKPYIIANENNFLIVEEVQSYICSLANRNSGSIFIAARHIKNIIKQGIKNINKSYEERLRTIISLAYNGIVGKENIGITVEAIPLKKDNKIKQNEYVIRINVNVNKNRQKEGFYTEYKFKNFKPVYKIYDLSVWSSSDYIQMKPVEIQNDYKKIQQMRGRQPELILCKCCQKFEAGIKINMNLITGVPMLKEQPNFNPHSQEYVTKLFDRVQKGFKDKEYLQHIEFPEISPYQSAAIFLINEICDKKLLLQIIESVFRDTKTPYKMIYPLKNFQALVNTSEKSAKPLVKICEIVYFIFEGRFDQFKSLFEEEIKKQALIRREQFSYEQLQNQIQLTYMINQNQIDKFNDLVYQIFVMVPTWDNMEYPQGKNQKKLYKNASVNFFDKNIAVFAYLIFYCAKLRPKFEKKDKKKQKQKQSIVPKYKVKQILQKKNDMFNIN